MTELVTRGKALATLRHQSLSLFAFCDTPEVGKNNHVYSFQITCIAVLQWSNNCSVICVHTLQYVHSSGRVSAQFSDILTDSQRIGWHIAGCGRLTSRRTA